MDDTLDEGFIYALGCKAMPGLIKIGYTRKSPQQRAAELSKATGVPVRFFIIHAVATLYPRKAEKLVHQHLRRHREGKEFYRVSAELAIEAMNEVTATWYDKGS